MIDTRILYGLAGLLLFAALYVAVLYLPSGPEPLIIHFDKYKGIDVWGQALDVYLLIGLGIAMNLVNILLGAAFVDRQTGVSRAGLQAIIASMNVFLSLLILIAVGVIISIN